MFDYLRGNRPQPREPQFPHLQTWWLRGSLHVECSAVTGYCIITGPGISHGQVQFICSNPHLRLPTDTPSRWGRTLQVRTRSLREDRALLKVNRELVAQSSSPYANCPDLHPTLPRSRSRFGFLHCRWCLTAPAAGTSDCTASLPRPPKPHTQYTLSAGRELHEGRLCLVLCYAFRT